MGRQANHHFIPQTYLKGFTGQDTTQFWAISLEQKKSFETTPRNVCSQRDYYTVKHENPLIVEQWYSSEIEPKIALFLQDIQKSNMITIENRANLTLLLATLYIRPPSTRAMLEDPRKQIQQMVQSIAKETKIRNQAEFDYTKTDLIRSELNLLNKIQKNLMNKYFQLCIIEDEQLDVITSDNPFVLSHELGGKEGFIYGLNTKGIEICVPLNRKQFIIGSNEPIKEGTYIADERIIGVVNTKIMLSSDRFFYSSKKEITLINEDLKPSQYLLEDIFAEAHASACSSL